jgi:hypothetical protein
VQPLDISTSLRVLCPSVMIIVCFQSIVPDPQRTRSEIVIDKVSIWQMVFATARLHVQLMQWEEPPVIEQSHALCDQLFERIPPHLV